MSKEMYIDIKKVTVAHRFTLFKGQKCDYRDGRKVCGLCYCTGGNVTYKFSTGEKYSISEGDVFFLPTNVSYTAYALNDFCHYTVNFVADVSACKPLLESSATILRDSDKGSFKMLFRELCDLYMKKGDGYSMRAIGYVYTLMAEFMEAFSLKKISSLSAGKLQKAKEYIDKNYKNRITVSELAKIADMSDTNFRREFKRVFGEAPMQYRDKVRLSYAKELLSSGFYNVGETASLVGIEDEGYFCRFFKKQTGRTPKEYIRKYV